MIAIALGMLGRMELDRGEDLGVARTLLNEARTIQKELGDWRNLPVQYGDLALIARIQGDLDAAESHIRVGFSIAQATGQVVFEAVAHLDLGIVAWLRGDLERSIWELRRAVQLFWPIRYAPDIAECLKAFAALALASGDAQGAARFLGGANALLRGLQPPRQITRLIDEHGRLTNSVRGKLGQEAFERAYAEADGWSMDDAVAAALAFDLPAGHAGQSDATEPAHGLSTREVEVLQLMANGLSNQQIADELFLSRRTVTSHVTHILGKLDLPSRTAAVSFAIRGGIA